MQDEIDTDSGYFYNRVVGGLEDVMETMIALGYAKEVAVAKITQILEAGWPEGDK